MNETHPDLKDNRFEAMYQNWRNRPRKPRRWGRGLLLLVVGLIALELGSAAAVFGWYRMQGIRSDRLLDQFYVTRYLVSSWAFENPITKNTKARYLGIRSNACVAAQWLEPDPLLGWRLTKSVGMLKQPYRVDDVTGWRFTNEQGFASSGEYEFFYQRPKPKGVFRIMVTGASSVEGDGAESPKHNLVAQFASVLNRDGKRIIPAGFERVEVINAGVGGYQSSQEYLNLITELVKYEPNLVVSYSGVVDLARARNAFDRQNRVMDPIRTYKHDEIEEYLHDSFSIASPLRQFVSNLGRAAGCVYDNLALSYLIDKVIERSRRVDSRIGVERKALGPASPNRDDAVPVAAALASYKNGIRLMEKAAELYGFKIAFFLQPVMGSDGKPLTDIEQEVFRSLSVAEVQLRKLYFGNAEAMMKKLADGNDSADHRVCFADLSHVFEGITERVWDDSFHLLGAGNRRVADAMLEKLRSCKQLPE